MGHRHDHAGAAPGAPGQESDRGDACSSEPEPPSVAGHDAVRLLGRGGFGDVWLLREQATGRLIAGKVVRAQAQGGSTASLGAARRELRPLRPREHPHLLACHGAARAEGAGSDHLVLLFPYAAGGSLARLVGVRGRLSAGETVTTIGPIAQALAALHADGVTHLDVSPGNILFSAQGKPLLSDLGTARIVGEPPGASVGTPGFEDPAAAKRSSARLYPAADVYGVGAAAWFCLTGSAPGPTAARPPLTLVAEGVPDELASAIDAALAEDPHERPTASEFARAVFRSARAEPVDLAPAVGLDVLPELLTRLQPTVRQRRLRAELMPWKARAPWARDTSRVRKPDRSPAGAEARRAAGAKGRRRARGRRATWSALLALSVAAAAGFAWAAAAGSEHLVQGPEGSLEPRSGVWSELREPLRRAAESSDPVQAVQALSEIRALAISTADRDLLARVNVGGSEAAAADTGLLDRLAEDGRRLEGFSSRVLTAELVSGSPQEPGDSHAVVRVRVVTSGYSVFSEGGRVVAPPSAGRDQSLRIVLERSEAGWRVARILPA